MSNDELDALVKEYINRHGETSGQAYVTGYRRSLGLHIQRQRIRDCMARLNPDNAILRCAWLWHEGGTMFRGQIRCGI